MIESNNSVPFKLVLRASKHFDVLQCGIRFRKDKDGGLPCIPEEIVLGLYDSIVADRNTSRLLRPWIVGDVAAYIDEMVKAGKWSPKLLQDFVGRLGYRDPNQVAKLRSLSRKFGWPDRPEKLRRTPPLGTQHHFAVMGADRRMELLDKAVTDGLNAKQLGALRHSNGLRVLAE
jgi:predicted NUDIX family NTP pyrophosphohydrolase